MKPTKALTIFIIALFCLVPSAAAQVTVGGSGGNITFTNPDNSTIYFDSGNQTTFAHISNWPDGWWDFPDVTLVDSELWAVGVAFGVIAIAVAVAFTVMRNKSND